MEKNSDHISKCELSLGDVAKNYISLFLYLLTIFNISEKYYFNNSAMQSSQVDSNFTFRRSFLRSQIVDFCEHFEGCGESGF